ncbi:MAG: DUF1566 domain-containing protein [Kiritimatiellales bacterium]|nr:DUF1566 domain-containing protein [Kiritimatiellales bacterium]
MSACAALTTAGYDDWRLPSVNELESLVDYGKPNAMLPTGHPFTGIQNTSSAKYWTSTLYSRDINYSYTVSFYNGCVANSQFGYYLACRGGVETQAVNPPEPVAQIPLPETGQTNSYAANDDGAIRAGVASPTPRFTTFSGIVVDNLTGLYWSTSVGSGSWENAVQAANQNNWRLPNLREMMSLIDWSRTDPALPEGHPFASFPSTAGPLFWTSTSSYGSLGNSYAWKVDIRRGTMSTTASKTDYGYFAFVNMVMDEDAPARVPITGQTNSYLVADDGAEQKGVKETGDRFTDNSNYTVNDNRTGLMWLKAPDACGSMTWAEAVEYCADLNYGGYTDWRLPNARELESLVDYSQGGDQTALPEGHPFADIDTSGQGHFFWTSTTSSSDSGKALALSLYQGSFTDGSKGAGIKVWPVRGGN